MPPASPPDTLRAISATARSMRRDMRPQMPWMQGYVPGGRVDNVYTAPDEASLREHAQRGGFPADRIPRVGAVIDPSTAG